MQIKTIYFATANEGKLKEASAILGIEVLGCGLDIAEIQSLDPIKVAVQKAKDYYLKLQKPILVEDVSLAFAALNGLPGPYINDFSKALGNTGLLELLVSKSVRSATAQTTLVFIDASQQEHVFMGKIKGTIAPAPTGDNGFGWDPIFIPQGHTKTFAQMTDAEKNTCSMRALAFQEFKTWINLSNFW
ncbi:MAG: Ham1 family protein [Candidatus Amesbacteria bacterium GW2011_GWB1_47_26]|uniref:Ham1 family protein n=1 Tax=Candidatus Amesbacteria bacterium GW2011_GWC2_45_19 TaxID=1618366 RepID=A0A0G1M4X0_9BACT|nr:MAG: Ham1 family protein [Candidatus Amesbacteria bacterium GW2011_GWC2_45_19]KKU37568.1 MAG: Ham1 family protein [Candidatus Amesbacteria bacterium GW2011_GWA1_46_35]KKU68940.1 MAG: Ham1 family protein [Microgenomates group bacterium GW2011_GWC1_47_20]KKU74371.1 MAG: Ham1 family protein [Candidatus Amesbacteria bacterium GW2011_GWB1_47_26]KKU78775.1 MAG: Ham1 family protein [Candidatus Amesbacteria bacterium GW2011_GWA2_47_70]